jgi:hypothetical protein
MRLAHILECCPMLSYQLECVSRVAAIDHLFQRDLSGERIDRLSDFKLFDDGFCYRYDQNFLLNGFKWLCWKIAEKEEWLVSAQHKECPRTILTEPSIWGDRYWPSRSCDAQTKSGGRGRQF